MKITVDKIDMEMKLPDFDPNCPVCSMAAVRERTLYDDRYGFPDSFDLYVCSQCGHRFLPISFSPDELTNLYTTFYPRSDWSLDDFKPKTPVQGFQDWLNGKISAAYCWVPGNVKVLDVGCGFGETLAYHQARGCDVYGVDTDQNLLRVAAKYGLNARVGMFSAKDYDSESFDYITLDQVLEHVAAPLNFMKEVGLVLRPGGRVIISTPNAHGWGAWFFGRRWLHWHVPYHQQFFSDKSLRLCADKAGFEVEKIFSRTSSAWLHLQLMHFVHFPEQGIPSAFWKTINGRSLLAKILSRVFGLFKIFYINHVVSRFLDTLRIGDNKLYFLRKKDHGKNLDSSSRS